MATTQPIQHSSGPSIPVRKVAVTAPINWIKLGITDLKKAMIPSLVYGLIFALIGVALTFFAASNPIWSAAFTTAFFLLGPFVAVGLYHLSWQIEIGEKPCLLDSFKHIKANIVNLGLFVVILGFLMMVWMRIAALVAGVYFGDVELITKGWSVLFTNAHSAEFVLFFSLFGFFIAQVAFSISVVSIPMIIHRKVDVISAIITSLRVVMKNPIPMLVWAILIVVLINLGFLFLFLGLTVTLPIIGHASWHAYRETVGED